MRKNWLTLSAALVACSIAAAARADTWTLTKGDLSELKDVTVNTWTAAEGLSVTDAGKLVKLETHSVLSLSSGRQISQQNGGAPWRLMLRNGDRLYGTPAGLSGQSLQFETAEMGKVLVPLKVISTIAEAASPLAAADSGALEQDQVRLKNKDFVAGMIISVNAEKVQVAVGAPDAPPRELEMAKVDRISFSGVTPAKGVPALSAKISFMSGSILTVPLDPKKAAFSWSLKDIALKDPAGKDRKTSADNVVSIDVIGGRVVYLTELDPAKDEQTTFMGTRWNTQVDKNVLGDPLKTGKKIFTRGLGVHTRSKLVYELDGSFETLKFQVGMDESAAPTGTAEVSVVLDGKTIWEMKGLKAGEPTAEVLLPVKGGKRLELHADPALGGGKLDILGRVNWLNIALLRQ